MLVERKDQPALTAEYLLRNVKGYKPKRAIKKGEEPDVAEEIEVEGQG